MAEISVLVAVDVENALSTNNLQNNLYMMDTNKHFGSGNEGTSELYTACHGGDRINWRVAPIAPSTSVSIYKFSGQMISQRICNPQKEGQESDQYWTSTVGNYSGQYQYTMTLDLGGRRMTFDPFLKVLAG